MALPILLLIMALMINYGVVACWKLRALTVSRHAVWSTRWPRTQSGGWERWPGSQGSYWTTRPPHAATGDPRPEIWPDEAGIGVRGLDRWTALDDPRVHHRVARGPLAPWARVREGRLDPARGPREGSSNIERNFPMLGRLGTYRLDARDSLLDNLWQYQRTGIPSNRHRRLPALYELARAPASYSQAYVEAVVAILYNPSRAALDPLDRDDEFLGYSARFGWGAGAPDFHPRLTRFCSLSHETAAERTDDVVERIIGRTERDADGNVTDHTPSLAERMTRAWIRLYRRVIDELNAAIAADPPPPPGAGAAMEAEIAQLEGRIDVLQKYLQSLEPSDAPN